MLRAYRRFQRDLDSGKAVSIDNFKKIYCIRNRCVVEPENSLLIESFAYDGGLFALVGLYMGWPVEHMVKCLISESGLWDEMVELQLFAKKERANVKRTQVDARETLKKALREGRKRRMRKAGKNAERVGLYPSRHVAYIVKASTYFRSRLELLEPAKNVQQQCSKN